MEECLTKARIVNAKVFMSEQQSDLFGCSAGGFHQQRNCSACTVSSTNAWNMNFQTGNMNNNNNKTNSNVVRPLASDDVVYDIPFTSIIEAYEDCVKNKRRSPDCVYYSMDFESGIYFTWLDIIHGRYKPGRSKCFIVTKPVLREVFAANFADRVVHHWIAMRINPLFEARFEAQGNVSFNCRKGYGIQSAVRYAESLIRDCSENYTKDCWIGKGDIKSYFMSMNKSLIWEMLSDFLYEKYHADDRDCLLYLLSVTIFNHPEKNCVRRTPKRMWDELPASKSLFSSEPDKGLPIGNLPSQLIANFYGSVFDYYVMEVLGIKHYARFVDDFVFVLKSKDDVKKAFRESAKFLREQLLVELHPKKIYIQHYSKGMYFVGTYLKPGRTYISNRTVGHFYDCLHRYNELADAGLQEEYVEKFVQSVNSYLGLMIHYNSYNIRKKICLRMILPKWGKFLYIAGHFQKACVKSEYKSSRKLWKSIKTKKANAILTPEICAAD